MADLELNLFPDFQCSFQYIVSPTEYLGMNTHRAPEDSGIHTRVLGRVLNLPFVQGEEET